MLYDELRKWGRKSNRWQNKKQQAERVVRGDLLLCSDKLAVRIGQYSLNRLHWFIFTGYFFASCGSSAHQDLYRQSLFARGVFHCDDASLLQEAAQQIASYATSIDEEIRITELIVILFDQQAERADNGLIWCSACTRKQKRPQTTAIYQSIVHPPRHNVRRSEV